LHIIRLVNVNKELSARSVTLPAAIEAQLEAGAVLAISISGGKDSQAMTEALVALHRQRGWKGEVFAIHADLGRIEWRQTPGHVKKIADDAGIPLVVVRRDDQGRGWDMIDRWIQRGEDTLAESGSGRPWSSSQHRFCTAELKRNPIDKYLRRYTNVVCAVGIRAEESPARAKKASWEYRQIHNTKRTATSWHPLLEWTTAEVFEACGHTLRDLRMRRAVYQAGRAAEALVGWSLHPAYVFGNERLSCQFCVLAGDNDLKVGAQHNPELLDELIAIEERFDFTFKTDRSLKTYRPEVRQLALAL
jgi:3'-phosphoadenosine 5'-phosphosulfate sulfotransferase (PAPS reductase)/FAD synthetase